MALVGHFELRPQTFVIEVQPPPVGALNRKG